MVSLSHSIQIIPTLWQSFPIYPNHSHLIPVSSTSSQSFPPYCSLPLLHSKLFLPYPNHSHLSPICPTLCHTFPLYSNFIHCFPNHFPFFPVLPILFNSFPLSKSSNFSSNFSSNEKSHLVFPLWHLNGVLLIVNWIKKGKETVPIPSPKWSLLEGASKGFHYIICTPLMSTPQQNSLPAPTWRHAD